MGWSAGGHLIAMAAILHAPVDAMLLWYPALAVDRDSWYARILLGRAEVSESSPNRLVRSDLPPTIIFQGNLDRVTPLEGSEEFCAAMVAAGNRCDLEIYPGREHLFTGDRDDYVDSLVKADRFLAELGFLRGEADPDAIRRLVEE